MAAKQPPTRWSAAVLIHMSNQGSETVTKKDGDGESVQTMLYEYRNQNNPNDNERWDSPGTGAARIGNMSEVACWLKEYIKTGIALTIAQSRL